jgi:GTP pyrophosphokinase
MKAEIILQKIINNCKKNNPDCNIGLIRDAYDFAAQAHQGQKRVSGEDYIFHLLATAETLANLQVDSKTIAAALLHDVLDDCSISKKELEKKFGKEIAFLVEGVTKIDKLHYHGVQRAVENLRKMFLAIAQDIRVILIKLADRLHNMRTLSVMPPEKQQRIALETMEVFAPLADRLGIGQIKGELQDLCFSYLMTGEYNWLKKQVKEKYEERKRYLEKIIPVIKKNLAKEKINSLEINHRAKHYWSLYQKLQRHEMNLNRIYDLVALRIIVKTIEDCYAVLGVIHKLWRPLPGRIKDYIALPKPNGYQSLHTTVFCQGGKITEIQIRTAQMDEEAERGIAAHWYYNEKKGLRAMLKRILTPAPEKELTWIKQLQEWQKEIKGSPDEFFQSLKIDFFKDRIFIFTPKGDVINLPDGATPIDFAYNIHSEIGHHCQGALVDDKLVSLDTPLANGQVVEIVTNKIQKPSRDWLKFAKTNLAKNRIKQWLGKYTTELITETDTKKEAPKPVETPKVLTKSPSQKFIIEVEGDYKIPTALAKCCEPQPGDPIKGYITLNQKITVHRADCSNLSRLRDQKRFVRVNWKEPH